MQVKYATSISMEDEFVRVGPGDLAKDVVGKMLPNRDPYSSQSLESISTTPTFAAYVMEGNKPVGVIDKDILLDAIVRRGVDLNTARARDLMKPPVIFQGDASVQDVINAIVDRGLTTVAIVEDDALLGVVSILDAFFLQRDMEPQIQEQGPED